MLQNLYVYICAYISTYTLTLYACKYVYVCTYCIRVLYVCAYT